MNNCSKIPIGTNKVFLLENNYDEMIIYSNFYLTIFILTTLYIIITYLLFYYYHNKLFYLKRRSLLGNFLIALGIYFYLMTSLYRRYQTRAHTNCSLYLGAYSLTIPLVASGLLIKLLNFGNNVKLSRVILNIDINNDDIMNNQNYNDNNNYDNDVTNNYQLKQQQEYNQNQKNKNILKIKKLCKLYLHIFYTLFSLEQQFNKIDKKQRIVIERTNTNLSTDLSVSNKTNINQLSIDINNENEIDNNSFDNKSTSNGSSIQNKYNFDDLNAYKFSISNSYNFLILIIAVLPEIIAIIYQLINDDIFSIKSSNFFCYF